LKKVLLDTNFILRYSLKDIESQYIQAQKTFKEIESGITRAYLSLLVINEFSWINEKYYKVPRTIYVSWLIKFVLLNKVEIVEVRKELVIQLLETMLKKNLDLTDLYLCCIKEDKKVLTFDKNLLKIL